MIKFVNYFSNPPELIAKILRHLSCYTVFESTGNSASFGLVLELTVNYGTQRKDRGKQMMDDPQIET